MTTKEFLKAVKNGQKEFEKLVFDSANFEFQTFEGIKFLNCTFLRCNFGHAQITDCDFSRNYLAYSDFNRTFLKGSKFDYAVMYRANLYNAKCAGASFKETLLSRRYIDKAIDLDTSNIANNFYRNTREKPPYAFPSDEEV